MGKVGPWLFRQCQNCLFPFSSCFRVLRHPGEGLVELEAIGSTSICHSFQKADISNELVSAFARSLVTSQHLTLPLISPALSFSSETGKERKKKDSEVRQQSKSQTECGQGADWRPAWVWDCYLGSLVFTVRDAKVRELSCPHTVPSSRLQAEFGLQAFCLLLPELEFQIPATHILLGKFEDRQDGWPAQGWPFQRWV